MTAVRPDRLPRAIESAPMRRWPVIIFLLLVLPFQMVWAAAAPVCAHETQAAAQQHFGHHEHLHQGSEPTPATADDSGTESSMSGAYHADCATCHFGTSVPLTSPAVAVAMDHHGAVHGSHGAQYRSHVPSGPERPDRFELTAAARFGGGVEFSPRPA